MREFSRYYYLKNALLAEIFLIILFIPSVLIANEGEVNFFDLSLEELMALKITSVSKKPEVISEAAAAIYVLTQEDLHRSGATSIPEVLRMVPGLQVAQIDSNKWAISSRGFNRQFSNKLLVMIDGRTVYTPLFSGVYWDAQDTVMQDIERIEVIRGPGSTLWGANAVNGVINIITKSAKDTQGLMVSAGVGTYERGFEEIRYGGKINDATYYRFYEKHNNRNELKIPNTNVGANDNWRVSRAGFRVDSELNHKDLLRIQGDIYSGNKNYQLSLPILTAPYISSINADEDFRGANLLASWKGVFSNRSKATFQTYLDYVNRDMRPQFELSQERITYDVDFQHTWNIDNSNQVIWGFGYRYISDKLNGNSYLIYTSDTKQDSLYSTFLQNKFTVLPEQLFFTVGSKFEYNNYTGFEYQPSARFSWLATNNTTFWASVARAVRTPTRNEYSLSSSGPALPPGILGTGSPAIMVTQNFNEGFDSEDLFAYEVGFRTKPSKHTFIDIAVFINDYDSIRTFEQGAPFVRIDPLFGAHLTVPLTAYNNGNAETYGIEVAATWDVTEKLRIFAGYTYLNMNIHLNDGSNDTITESDEGKNPRNQFSIRSYYQMRHNLGWDSFLYYVDNLSSLNIDSYIRVDSRLAWDITHNLELSIIGQNLFDNYHEEFVESLYGTASQAGRSFYAKATFNF